MEQQFRYPSPTARIEREDLFEASGSLFGGVSKQKAREISEMSMCRFPLIRLSYRNGFACEARSRVHQWSTTVSWDSGNVTVCVKLLRFEVTLRYNIGKR